MTDLTIYPAVARRLMDDIALGGPPHPFAPPVRRVVAVSGAAALGKTWFCRHLREYLSSEGVSAVHLQLDGFLKDRVARQREGLSGYDPRATNLRALVEVLEKLLLRGEAVEVPRYSHSTGGHDAPERVSPAEVVLLDGIISLHHEIRSRFPSFGIFVRADDVTMHGLRVLVDIQERGYTIFQALTHVMHEMRFYDRWIHHQGEFADLRISVSQDRTLRIE